MLWYADVVFYAFLFSLLTTVDFFVSSTLEYFFSERFSSSMTLCSGTSIEV